MAPHTTERTEDLATPPKTLPVVNDAKTIPDINAAQSQPASAFQPEDHPIDQTPPLKVGLF
jgi:hypothetical protein